MNRLQSKDLPALGFAVASAVLAFEPMVWLVGTWRDPSYSSTGALYLFAIAALALWTLTSPVRQARSDSRQHAVMLLGASALIRLASQVFAINVVGGLALALDVFALATLMRTDGRSRPISAFWLSVLFLFTLPVERILQRMIGYPLQEISARLSCSGLGIFFDDLACQGVRIRLAGENVLVDLPCSGTGGLMLAMALLVILNVLYRPRFPVAVAWIGIALGLSVVGNALRIGLLAIGLAFPDRLFGLNVMARPLHDIIGLATLALSMAPVLLLYKPVPAPPNRMFAVFPRWRTVKAVREVAAVTFVAFAVLVTGLPRHALDVSAATPMSPLPLTLGGETGRDEPLTHVERSYLTQYGGSAKKRRYGPLTLTMVRTSSPLRHLHSPEDCLRGLGYRVEFLGSQFTPVPTALYRATSKQGGTWRVAVSFVSDRGDTTHNIAEAIWLWLQAPHTTWTSIQRITPWAMAEPVRADFETAVIAALDLPRNQIEEGQIP